MHFILGILLFSVWAYWFKENIKEETKEEIEEEKYNGLDHY